MRPLLGKRQKALILPLALGDRSAFISARATEDYREYHLKFLPSSVMPEAILTVPHVTLSMLGAQTLEQARWSMGSPFHPAFPR